MRRYYLPNLLVKILILSSAVASVEAVGPPGSPISQKTLKVRGGSNPLAGVETTNAITKLGLGLGTATVVSTSAVLDNIGIKNADPMDHHVMRLVGLAIQQYSIIAYCLLYQETSPSTAVGISILPFIVHVAKTLLDGTPKELGFAAEGQVFALLVTVTFTYLFLNDSPFSKASVLKVNSGWMLLNGVLFGFFPKLALKAWAIMDVPHLSQLQSFVSLLGFGYISMGTVEAFLSTDMMTTKALALGTIPFLCRLLFSKLAR